MKLGKDIKKDILDKYINLLPLLHYLINFNKFIDLIIHFINQFLINYFILNLFISPDLILAINS